MLRSHLDAVLAWAKTRLSNGAAEGMNKRIKSINHGSFGYRSAVAAIYLCCASLPLAALPALAAVRCVPDVTVAVVGERAWLHWPSGNAEVLHCVAALPGVELFEPREGRWYRPRQHLPAFGLPLHAASEF